MVYGIHFLLLMSFFFVQVNCGNANHEASNNIGNEVVKGDSTPVISVPASDSEMERLVRNCGCREGDETLKKIMSMPRNRVIPLLEKLKGLKPGDKHSNFEIRLLRLKSAFLLSQIEEDPEINEKIVIEEATLKLSQKGAHLKAEAIAFLGIYIKNGKKKLLPIVFSAASESDASLAQEIMSIFEVEINASTKDFLKNLKNETPKMRKAVYRLIKYISNDQIKAQIRAAAVDEQLEEISTETLAEIEP